MASSAWASVRSALKPPVDTRAQPNGSPPPEVDPSDIQLEFLGTDRPGGDLRHQVARGTIINAAFNVGLAGLLLLQRLIVAAFLTAAEFGIWGLVFVTLMTVMFIKNAGIGDKFVQQSEDDQEVAFQKAFTIELLITGVLVLAGALAMPLFALIYGRPDIIVPGIVLCLAVLGNSLQAPTWIYYRNMDFLRQRILMSVQPVVMFIVAVSLAIAGAGYWSLVMGALVGAWAGGLVALRACPYRIRLRVHLGTIRDYFQFSWPLVTASAGVIVVVQGSMLVGSRTVGLAGVGAIGLGSAIIQFADGVDAIVTQALYPAICAVRDRTELLFEAFVKSNRLALMWGVAFGLGLTLFAADLVHFVIGDSWEPAIVVLQYFGVIAATEQLGFNWTAFLRARNETRPLAVIAVAMVVLFFTITVPLLILGGLQGYAIGMLAMSLATLLLRSYYLSRLFAGFHMARHTLRAVGPSIPAVGAVLVMRLIENGQRTPGIALLELAVYAIVTAIATYTMERSLLTEVWGYVRPRAAKAVSGPA
jgi:O-antigen/teichoic acid export membrane protein